MAAAVGIGSGAVCTSSCVPLPARLPGTVGFLPLYIDGQLAGFHLGMALGAFACSLSSDSAQPAWQFHRVLLSSDTSRGQAGPWPGSSAAG
jgi:hypothetical protein